MKTRLLTIVAMMCMAVLAKADDEPAYKVVEVDLTAPEKNVGSTSTITVDLNEDVYIMAKSAGSIHEHDWGLSIKGAESTTNVLRINASSGHKITKVVYTFASSATRHTTRRTTSKQTKCNHQDERDG